MRRVDPAAGRPVRHRPGRAAAGTRARRERIPAHPVRPTARCATPSTCRPAPDARSTGRSGCPPGARGVRRAGRAAALEPPGAGRRAWRTPDGTSWWRPARRRGSRWPTSCRCWRPSPRTGGATALYLSPTKALAADQLRALAALDLPDVRAAPYDGDTPLAERDWARQHGRWLFSNPDMLHRSLLPQHGRWAELSAPPALRRAGRVPHLPRACSARTWRCCCAACCGSAPATERVRRSCWRRRRWRTRRPSRRGWSGGEVVAVSDDGSPTAGRTVALWEPPLLDELTGRERRAGAAIRGRGVGADAGGPRHRRCAHAGLRPFASGCGVDGARRAAGARRGGPGAGGPGVALPGRLPAGGAAGAGGRPGPR